MQLLVENIVTPQDQMYGKDLDIFQKSLHEMVAADIALT